MTRLLYRVVGGEYGALPFPTAALGTEQAIGSFADRTFAPAAWRNVSEQSRHRRLVRVAVASEAQCVTAA